MKLSKNVNEFMQNKMRVAKLAIAVFCAAALITLLANAPRTSQATSVTPAIAPTATVSPMIVGQPMMLTDANGNTFMIMQGSTFFVFPKQEPTQSPK